MKRPPNGSTPRQMHYAQQRLGTNKSSRQIALSVGYAPSTAHKAIKKIEEAEGTQIAYAKLFAKAGNVTMQVLHELSKRDLSTFSNRDLLTGISTMINAFDKLQKKDAPAVAVQNNLKNVFVTMQKATDAKAIEIKEDNAKVIGVGNDGIADNNTSEQKENAEDHIADMQ